MALDKQLVNIDFTQGVDTKSDKKLTIPGKLTTMNNAVFSALNTINKRPGSVQLGTRNILGGGSVTSGTAVNVFGPELLEQVGSTLYGYTPNGLVSRGTRSVISSTRQALLRNGTPTDYEVCSANGVIAMAMINAPVSGGTNVMVSAVDDTRFSSLFNAVEFSSSGTQSVRMVALGTDILLFYINGANVIGRLLNTSSPTGFGAAVNIATNSHATPFIDAIAMSDDITATIIYRNNTGANGNVALVQTDNTLAALRSATIASSPTDGVCVGTWGSGRVCAAWRVSTTGLNFVSLTSTLTAPTAATVIDAAGTDRFPMTMAPANAADTSAVFFHGRAGAAGTHLDLINKSTITDAGTVSVASAVFVRGADIAGRPLYIDGAGPYLPTQHESALQPTFFLYDSAGIVAARLLSGAGGGRISSYAPAPANITLSDGRQALLAMEVLVLGAAVTAINVPTLAILSTTAALSGVQLDAGLHLAGAIPAFYDGQTVVEDGFSIYPENLTAASGGAGSLSAGTYQMKATIVWHDAQGVRHQSAPSPAVTYVAGASDSATITIPTIKQTSKTASGGRAAATIDVYRTKVNATTFYYDARVTNSITADTVTVLCTQADSALAGELLYTQGGALENIAPPAHRFSCVHDGSLVLGGLEDPLELNISQDPVANEGTRFFDDSPYLRRLPPDGGDITGLASSDGHLIVFKDSRIFIIDGAGPSLSGQQDNRTDARLLPTSVGCTDWRSIATFDGGVLFKSARGIHLLNRSLEVSYIGADVEKYNSQTIVGTVVERGNGLIRFFATASGNTREMVYDYVHGQWSTSSGHLAVGAVRWNNKPTWVLGSGVLAQDDAAFTDAGAIVYDQTIETGWLKFAGVQGFQRVYRMLVEGQQKSPCTLTISVAYDYSDTYSYSFTYAVAGGDIPLQIRHHLRTQKCEAIRFKIEETASTTPFSGVSLTSMALEVGVKRGAYKLPAVQTVA